MNDYTRIKCAHLTSFIVGTHRAARWYGVRAHWISSARRCGYTFWLFQIGMR